MVASVSSFGGFSLDRGPTARAARQAAPPPVQRDQPRQPPAQPQAQHTGSIVAFAPAAMSVLIEAQERLAHQAAPIVREQTAQKIDGLIERMAGSPAPTDVSFGVRRLEAAREALSLAPVSFGDLDLST